ncbi:MAG: DUF1501 domain-containing protein [Pirellulaceae bacterium]
MLGLLGKGSTYCDGVSRRNFLGAGVLGLSGLTLAEVLRGRALAGENRQANTSVIFVELAGGPTQFETYDPKPTAPAEYRGPLSAIATNLPGVMFSQYMAEQAKIADRLTVVRSIRHNSSSHDPSSHLTQTGYYKTGQKGGENQMPSIGAVAAKFRGPNHVAMPAYVAVPQVMRNGGAAQLGLACAPFQTGGDPNSNKFQVMNLGTLESLTADRLGNRSQLLAQLDARRELNDLNGSATAVDQFTQKAFDLVTGSQARLAFDIAEESDSIRDAYGRTTVGQSMLLARRLVEAGVTCVTVRVTGWDDHSNIAKAMATKGPAYDQGLAALVRDLGDRGLEQDVLVVAMGEFGRTPKINKNAGRDHWGSLMSVLLAGGRLQRGVFGESNSKGEVPANMPYRPENVLATIYHHLGIDPSQTFTDLSGRPRYVLEEREVIREIMA